MMRLLGLPLVMISHSPEITDIATKVITLAKVDGMTEVVSGEDLPAAIAL